MNLISQLLNYRSFTPTERMIVKYILDNVDDVPSLTISQLASMTHTSNPVIIRLCKKLNVNGFKDFKIKLSKDLEKYRQSKMEVDVNYPFKMHANALEVSKSIATLTKNTVDSCYKELNSRLLNQVSKTIYNSKNVYIYGTGDSYIRALSFKNKLIKIGKNINNTSFSGENYVYSFFSNSQDCAIFVSYSGLNENYLFYAQQLKANRTPIILITANSNSSLSKIADYVLTIPDLENPLDNIATFYSQLALDYILNIIYSLIYAMFYQENQKKKRNVASVPQRMQHHHNHSK